MIVQIKRREVQKRLAVKNLSLNGFARKIGISSGYISQLMSGSRNPSPKVRQAFLKELKCHFDDIFFIPEQEQSK